MKHDADFQRPDFSLSEYGDDGLLRIGWPLWLTMVFLGRHLLSLVLGAASSFVGAGQGLQVIYSRPEFLLASLPAIIVLIAAIRRRPGVAGWRQRLWGSGRWWLLSAAVLDLGLLLTALLRGHLPLNEYLALSGLCDLYALLYLLRSRRLRWVFANHSFPLA